MKEECPHCENDIIVFIWEDFNCPHCNNKGEWDSYLLYDEDGNIEDEIEFIDWEKTK